MIACFRRGLEGLSLGPQTQIDYNSPGCNSRCDHGCALLNTQGIHCMHYASTVTFERFLSTHGWERTLFLSPYVKRASTEVDSLPHHDSERVWDRLLYRYFVIDLYFISDWHPHLSLGYLTFIEWPTTRQTKVATYLNQRRSNGILHSSTILIVHWLFCLLFLQVALPPFVYFEPSFDQLILIIFLDSLCVKGVSSSIAIRRAEKQTSDSGL